MRVHLFCSTLALIFGATASSAQSSAVHVCVVQADPSTTDAKKLAEELSARKLVHDVQIIGTAYSRKPGTRAGDELKDQNCDFIVTIWRHEVHPEPEFTAADGTGVPSPQAIADRDTVDYELRRAGRDKVLARGLAPPPIVYVRRGRVLVTPYPLFASQIVAKLNKQREPE
jgi:hypothetical protein